MTPIFLFSGMIHFWQDCSSGYGTGAGTYTLVGNDYTENLEYCNYRDWENHEFKFKLIINGNTLRQQGIEKIDSLNVNREIIETYVRIQ